MHEARLPGSLDRPPKKETQLSWMKDVFDCNRGYGGNLLLLYHGLYEGCEDSVDVTKSGQMPPGYEILEHIVYD
ncbi:predicted protein [Botrytis cinerea T4]|uniref:Uncharacterized protein n=1 Tax=Botryotinia fuckeliana (strain T4) TaxID=999810 RepID=G2YHG1_BOTF4|nr:predicted protein [Botrytis cinerea T4]